MNSPSKRKG